MPASAKSVSSLWWFASLSLLLSLLPARALGQASINDVFVTQRMGGVHASAANPAGSALHLLKKDVSLVLVPVTVTDTMARLVTGLGRDNFQVFEGKKQQEIRHFSSEDAPVSVGIILDSSGSMRDKMDRVREAVHQFCHDANPQDEFFLITFSDEPRLAIDFTKNAEDLEKELIFTVAKGRTSLVDAIYMGVQNMRKATFGRKALLIISDGGDNHSRYTPRDVKGAIKESDIQVYAIGTYDRYVPTLEEALGPELLRGITEPTGGRAFTLESVNQMPEVAHRIGTELRTQYVLGYRPGNVPHDGKWRKITVKLMLPKRLHFLQVHARKGYYSTQ